MQALRLHSIVIMHLLSEPVGGLGGDFEFTIMSAAPDKVVMSGTKTRNMITLTPMPKERTWTSYLEGVLANQDAIFLGTFKLMVNGKKSGRLCKIIMCLLLLIMVQTSVTLRWKFLFIY